MSAALLLEGIRIWILLGAAVSAVFLTVGMDRIDEDARGAYVFRPLLIPGVLLIWPFVLWRWYLYETNSENWKSRYRPPRRAHQTVGLCLSLGICAIILTGLTLRQTWPTNTTPVQLSAPPEAEQ